MRNSGVAPLVWVAAIYVNFFRSLPLILVIFWFYFLVPLVIGEAVGGFQSALIAFTLFEAAYYSEIMRAGLSSVSRGQINAGFALGFTWRQNMQFVILPQAFRNMLPVLVTQGIILFQDTSLVYVVALRDFMTAASVVATREGRLIELYVFAAVVYFVICFAGSLFVRRLQKRKVA
jgi:glutamate/aspartate transport system permease protein